MMRGIVTNVATALLVVCLLLASCVQPEGGVTELPLTPVLLIQQLNFELSDFMGEKVWVSGYYGDSRISGAGYGFLVTEFHMLLVDEKLPDHSCVLLDGELPSYADTGAEILLYGEVKDFAQTYDAFTLEPTALITVEQYYVLSPPVVALTSSDSPFDVSFGTAVPQGSSAPIRAYAQGNGTRAKDCDRALILSGGVDERNNYARYKDNVIMKYKKLRELGFNDTQIAVLYDNGKAIDVDGRNITDGAASKKNVKETLEKFAKDMVECCTLTIMVTDHGTGYSQEQCYHGARPALNETREKGITYAEKDLKVDLRRKVYRLTSIWTTGGKEFFAAKDMTGRVEIYMRQSGGWVFKGYDANGDGFITEREVKEDLNGNGNDTDRVGWPLANIERRLLADVRHQDNEWDTDGDGNIDVRARWDGTRYVLERLKDGKWEEMARDTDGDFIIDGRDGGIDWNLDGDKNDQIGFHEGINLWGREVLWDDELADLLKPLHDKGIHIIVEMISCFSGGFVENLKGLVDKIVTYSGEDTKHWNRVASDNTTIYAADQKAFVGNLTGIDLESWNTAFRKGIEADEAAWKAAGSDPKEKNEYRSWEMPTDAWIEFATWTINGVPVQPGAYGVVPCYITDTHFRQRVDGRRGRNVTLTETSSLNITYVAGPAPVGIYAANHLCAVAKDLDALKKSQVVSMGGKPVQAGIYIPLSPQVSVDLGVETDWQLVQCLNYTKSINWFGISAFEPVLHTCVLFELVLQEPGTYYFKLQSYASVTLVDGEDVNTDNNETGWSPPLMLTVTVVTVPGEGPGPDLG